MNEIAASVAALGPGALDEPGLRRHVDPLFSRVLGEAEGRIYLANHSLGRPLDRMAADVAEALSAWYGRLDEAWDVWLAEIARFRARIAALVNAAGPQCIVPKASAGQGLRAVLNCFDTPLKVVSTRSEFASVAVILGAYAARGRVLMEWVAPARGRFYRIDDFARALEARPDLLVLSLIYYDTGQLMTEIEAVTALARAAGALVLVDLYHAVGAVPVDLSALCVDFAIGGGYKYLRGGPGAGWLYVHPQHLERGLRSLDIGWFATADRFAFVRTDPPHFAPGADGWLESTPAVLPFYQARAGLEFTLAIGVERLHAYSSIQQARLVDGLAARGIGVLAAKSPHGAFIVIETPQAEAAAARLHRRGLVVDTRGGLLRLCPDILTTPSELDTATRLVCDALGTA
jgi:kynureninase